MNLPLSSLDGNLIFETFGMFEAAIYIYMIYLQVFAVCLGALAFSSIQALVFVSDVHHLWMDV